VTASFRLGARQNKAKVEEGGGRAGKLKANKARPQSKANRLRARASVGRQSAGATLPTAKRRKMGRTVL